MCRGRLEPGVCPRKGSGFCPERPRLLHFCFNKEINIAGPRGHKNAEKLWPAGAVRRRGAGLAEREGEGQEAGFVARRGRGETKKSGGRAGGAGSCAYSLHPLQAHPPCNESTNCVSAESSPRVSLMG